MADKKYTLWTATFVVDGEQPALDDGLPFRRAAIHAMERAGFRVLRANSGVTRVLTEEELQAMIEAEDA